MIDAHCHLFFDAFEGQLDGLRERARACGVEHVITVGTELETSRAALEMAARDPWQSATVGLHPHAAQRVREERYRRELEELASGPGVVAVGEAGLDFFKDYAPREDQREAFLWQLRLAHEVGLPLVVHTRAAHAATLELLRAEGRGLRMVVHCFTGGPGEAEDYLELGCCLSFSGALTYSGSEANREAARRAPLERLMVETDAPFLAPVPHRGKRNEPAFVSHTLARLAAVREVELAAAEAATASCTREFFGLEPPL